MYFIQKEGVCSHGIFWYGDSEEEGRKKTGALAQLDCDDYHSWVLYRFVEQTDMTEDSEHERVYKTAKASD